MSEHSEHPATVPYGRYAQMVADKQAAEQELLHAGEIQASFLPKKLPPLPGWQLALELQPARQTGGDFYDVISLPNGRVGLVMADVAGKGTSAALFMALSRTLLRTFAILYHTRPDYAMRAANHRIRVDSDADLFVTLFLGILDPARGTLLYANGGHNPPYLLRSQPPFRVEALHRTGLPLGILEGEPWERASVDISNGDILLLYTDGITEAQDAHGHFFGVERLLAILRENRSQSASQIRAAVLSGVSAFVGNAPQADDMALMVLRRL